MLAYHEAHPYSYNEVVLDTRHWEARMPATIEAFVYARGGGDRARACASLMKFRREFPKAAAVVPLVSFDPGDVEQPFSEDVAC